MLEAIKMYFFPCLLNALTVLFLIDSIICKKIDIKKKRLFIIILTVVLYINNLYMNESYKFFISVVAILLLSKFIYNEKIDFIIITNIFAHIIMFISEFIYSVVMIIIFNDIQFLFDEKLWLLISNLFICVLSILILKIDLINRNIKKIVNISNKIDKLTKYSIVLFSITVINMLLFYIYKNYNDKYYIFLNSLLMIIYIFIFFMLLIEKNKNIMFMEEKQILISSLNEYEKMLDYQRVNNHENKNQLLVIKSMVEKKDNKTLDYINEIIKEKREDNEIIYNKAKRIPSGGLQGLIYQKMLLMQENNIEIILDINSKVRKIDFGNLSSKMNYDICRIVGIIVDNAIEETKKFNKKEREIIISMYVDSLFFIEISNRIKDDVDLNKIYEKGYTNKEKGHGYGLSLLKKIVNENDNIINEVSITNNIFTQIIKIKM